VTEAELGRQYLDLVEAAISHSLYAHADAVPPGSNPLSRRLRRVARRAGWVTVRLRPIEQSGSVEGRGDWPLYAQSMIGQVRLRSLRECVETILVDQVPGDLIEAGVWRGGACVLMRAVLAAHGDGERSVWCADSFAGLPPPDPELHPADRAMRLHREPELAVPRTEVEATFRRYRLLDDRVRFVEGWFSDTLPELAGRTWSLIRVDGDMYGSTMDALRNLYPGLAPGGFVIVDDYGAVEACRRAVEDFRREGAITEPLVRIDWTGVLWRRDA
jgi:O-methyltransferase